MSDQEKEAKKPARVRRPRRWKRRLIMLCLLVLLLAPTAISLSGRTHFLLSRLMPQLADALEFRSASLHWWSAVELTDVRLQDLRGNSTDDAEPSHGQSLLTARRVVTSEPLWRVVLQRGRDLTVQLDEPRLNVVVDEHGNNVKTTLETLFGSSEESARETFPIRLRVREGTVTTHAALTPGSAPQSVTITDLQADVSTLNPQTLLPEIELQARLEPGDAGLAAARSASTSGQTVRIAAADPAFTLNGHALPQPLDHPPGEHGIRLRVSDQDDGSRQFVQFATSGIQLEWLQPILSMFADGAACRGMISGSLEVSLAGRSLSQGVAARMDLNGTDVSYRDASWSDQEWLDLGRTQANGLFVWARDGVLLENVRVESDVVQLSGGGEVRSASLNEPTEQSGGRVAQDAQSKSKAQLVGQLDLARLLSMLPKTLAVHQDLEVKTAIVEFGFRAEAGPAEGESRDHLGLPSAARWQAFVSSDGIDASKAGERVVWRDPARLEAVGRLVQGQPVVSDIQLKSGVGTLDVAAVEDAYHVTGRIEPQRLWTQIAQFVDFEPPALNSSLDVNTLVKWSDGGDFLLRDLSLTSQELSIRSESLLVRPGNPLLSLLRGTIHVAGQATAMKTVMAPWYTADWLADQSHIDFHLTSAGQGGYQVLAEVTPRQLAARGNQRVLSVAHSESRDDRSSQYQAVSASGVQAFRVDQARLGLELRPDASLRRFEITSGRLELPGLTALPSGVVMIDTDETILDLTVATQIDLDQLSRRVLATGSEIRFYGAGAQTFQITGSLNRLRGDRYARSESSSTADSPATGVSPLQIAGGISWERASLFGFDVDATSLQGTLENGVIRTQPIQTRVNGGQLNVMPQLDLDRQRLQLATGSRVSQLQLTPALCRRWVSYAVPVLADSSNVSGTVSARIQSFDFDLQNPERSTASGAMTIHAAEAAPTSELLALLQALDAIRLATKGKSDYSTKSITMQAQEVPITLSQGVISHSDMTFDLSDYRVRSSGQVGMNRSVRLVLDIPLEKMKGSSDYRTVRVPVGGTLDRLQIDTRQLLQGLGAREIENQINQQIDRQLKGLLDKL